VSSRDTSISPAPTDEEAVAIVAAVEALWPKPVMSVDETRRRNTAWRFSGRWWAKPLPTRRDRPFH
jgi:hypothetical protein